MNAHALLSAQGWRGKGHSLHKTDDSIGLAKPLLLPKKDGKCGIGSSQHFTSDQWWMNAFDEQLKGLDTSKEGRVTQTVTTGKLNSIDKGSLGKYYLYTSFVRGGLLEGTILSLEDELSSSDAQNKPMAHKKSKDAPSAVDAKETKEERKARRKERRRQKTLERRQKKLVRRTAKVGAGSTDALPEKGEKRRKTKDKKKGAASSDTGRKG
ncbi:hypothetical protein CP532_2257 [Ophiocordyceps camponoti-leonardi (nom. inval.)]|nr:hypothetical protein CP532_2257 [Ophiocordyceps camponoti-leonardi (nom. inval.)]